MADNGLLALKGETILRLDRGMLSACLEKAIERAVADCVDRPGDDRARVVILKLEVKPKAETRENVITCEGAAATYKVTAKNPPWESQSLDFGVRRLAGKDVLVFSDHSPSDHQQTTFFDGEED